MFDAEDCADFGQGKRAIVSSYKSCVCDFFYSVV